MQSKSAIQISRARLCSVENIGTYCAASWYRSKSAEEKDLKLLYRGGIVTSVFVYHVQHILKCNRSLVESY